VASHRHSAAGRWHYASHPVVVIQIVLNQATCIVPDSARKRSDTFSFQRSVSAFDLSVRLRIAG
jgi:hypothetical protein